MTGAPDFERKTSLVPVKKLLSSTATYIGFKASSQDSFGLGPPPLDSLLPCSSFRAAEVSAKLEAVDEQDLATAQSVNAFYHHTDALSRQIHIHPREMVIRLGVGTIRPAAHRRANILSSSDDRSRDSQCTTLRSKGKPAAGRRTSPKGSKDPSMSPYQSRPSLVSHPPQMHRRRRRFVGAWLENRWGQMWPRIYHFDRRRRQSHPPRSRKKSPCHRLTHHRPRCLTSLPSRSTRLVTLKSALAVDPHVSRLGGRSDGAVRSLGEICGNGTICRRRW
ncbi:hypothetical protein R3P38DRAFT_3343438 [Favolaschia claudopus]|uniref:Uncharacterized protein n=1 Tax=Favolaschia claudopus TaxID=2862362 RepID=A0AAW0DSJ5_9AGAR